jgi:iron complex outermembrane receptor protein
VVLVDDKPTEDRDDGVPATLPRGLQRNVPANARLRVQDSSGTPLTIEEVTNPLVVSASKRLEAATSAPSWVYVLSAKDIRDRGYTELSQMLDDLPGMDVNRPYGDVYMRAYLRGYRPGAGSDPFLIMIDGVVFNSLFFKDTQMLATFPLSNIERVEVVYGPASALYGPNAAMGVINVITKDGAHKQENNELGATVDTRITFGGAQKNLKRFDDMTKIVDATMLYTAKDYRLRVTTRLEDGVLDTAIGDSFEYTKTKYYAEPRIWGAQVLQEYPVIAGKFRSPDQKRAVDARVYFGAGTEIAAQFFQLSTGLGTRYPSDRYQTQTPWTTSELSIYGSHTAKLSENVISKSFAQYRVSKVDSPSPSLGRYRSAGATTFDDVGPTYLNVRAPNSGIVVQQDLDIAVARNLFMENDQVTVNSGLRYQHLELSRNYTFDSITTFPLADADPIGNARNDNATAPQYATALLPVDTFGPYLLGRYLFAGTQALNVGGRLDYSTLFGQFFATVRGGYVGTFDKLTVKALYGQAVDEPPPLIGSRAKEELKPELSQTIEGSVDYTFWKLGVHGGVYYVDYSRPIIGAKNLETRRASGADIGVRFLAQPVQLWAYYSRYLLAEGSTLAGGIAPTGDLARDKVWAGATFDKGPFTATLLGRWMGEREPVTTNPLGTVPSYLVLDANVRVSHVGFDGLWLAFRVANLLDTRYQHPGQESAGGGATPAIFSGSTYTGSRDDFNSRLPQPGRSLFLTLGLDT